MKSKQEESVDTQKMLQDLRQRARLLDEAILAVERLALDGKKKRGRPPKWLVDRKANAKSTPTKHPSDKTRISPQEGGKPRPGFYKFVEVIRLGDLTMTKRPPGREWFQFAARKALSSASHE